MPKPIRIGPSWTEVFFGAFLSLLLGVVLAAAVLILRPVTTVKELPKEADRKSDVIYYIEGSRDGTKGRQAETKRKTFAGGASVSVNEDEINVLATPKPPPPKPSAPKKAGDAPVPMTADATVLPPNFRIHQGTMQIAVPVKVNVMGVDETIVVLTRGGFERQEGKFVYVPEAISVGSCPLDRLPVLNSWVLEKFIGAQPVPEDIAASWAKLVAVHIDGSELKLTMP